MIKRIKGYIVVNSNDEIIDVYDRGIFYADRYAAQTAARRAGDSMWGGLGKHIVVPVVITERKERD
jgi:hypothetical protein